MLANDVLGCLVGPILGGVRGHRGYDNVRLLERVLEKENTLDQMTCRYSLKSLTAAVRSSWYNS